MGNPAVFDAMAALTAGIASQTAHARSGRHPILLSAATGDLRLLPAAGSREPRPARWSSSGRSGCPSPNSYFKRKTSLILRMDDLLTGKLTSRWEAITCRVMSSAARPNRLWKTFRSRAIIDRLDASGETQPWPYRSVSPQMGLKLASIRRGFFPSDEIVRLHSVSSELRFAAQKAGTRPPPTATILTRQKTAAFSI
jgi:hypothetical protein